MGAAWGANHISPFRQTPNNISGRTGTNHLASPSRPFHSKPPVAGGVFTSTASGQQAGEERAESSKSAHLKEQTWAAQTDAKYPGQS